MFCEFPLLSSFVFTKNRTLRENLSTIKYGRFVFSCLGDYEKYRTLRENLDV
jgi:hypothetical protein